MEKRLAILLLRVAGAPDQPTRRYAENLFTNAGRGTRNLVDFYDEVSHGNIDLGRSEVFGWMDYNHTNQDLTDEYTKAYDEKKKELLDGKVSEAEAEKQAREHAHRTRRDKIVQWGRDAATAQQIDLARPLRWGQAATCNKQREQRIEPATTAADIPNVTGRPPPADPLRPERSKCSTSGEPNQQTQVTLAEPPLVHGSRN